MRWVITSCLVLSACTTEVVDPAPPNDCTAPGPELVPLECNAQVALSASTAAEWLGVVECSGSDALPSLEAQLDATEGDETVVDAFFSIVDQTWTFDGTTANCTNADDTWFALAAITALHDPLAFDRLDALVWRPLPTPTFQLEADEYKAAIAIACIATPEAQTEAQNIAANHPSSLVRQLTAVAITSQKCTMGDQF